MVHHRCVCVDRETHVAFKDVQVEGGRVCTVELVKCAHEQRADRSGEGSVGSRPVGCYQEDGRAQQRVFVFNEVAFAPRLPVAMGPVRVFVIRVTSSHRADDHKRSLLQRPQAPGECVPL